LLFQAKLCCASNACPRVLITLHDVFMREDVGTAGAAFEVTQGVVFARVGLDNTEVIRGAIGALGFHAL
jgi:hypothetical protein